MKPVLQALLIADRIYQDAITGKKIIAGTFDRLCFRRTPAPQPPVEENGPKVVKGGLHAGSPYAFVSMTEVRGAVDCVLRYVDLEDYQPLMQTQFVVECDDPLKTVELVIPLPPLPTVKAGVHVLELLCNNEPVGSLRIHVDEIKDDEHADP